MTTPIKVRLGALAWCAFTYFNVANFKHGPWAEALVLLAALVLMPMTWCLARDLDDQGWAARLWKFDLHLQLPAALLLIPAFVLPRGQGAALCALPWFVMLAVMAVDGLLRIRRHGVKPSGVFCRDAGLVFAAIGGACLLADRAGWQPLGLSQMIVLLAAAHFHYAGLILPVLAGLALTRRPECPLGRWSMWLVLLGVPLVAVGILMSQAGGPVWVEMLAAWVLVLGGLGVAWQHIALAVTESQVGAVVRGMWGAAGVALIVGMTAVGVYTLRGLEGMEWLDARWVLALHGSLNALGFSLLALLAWCRAGRQCCCGT
ncbi:MAG: YndJ family transporter [Opitutaceae bacterium]|nr:YndJ family transporter [Opitutaceae bacterium]